MNCKILLIDDKPQNIEEDIKSIVEDYPNLFEYTGHIDYEKDFTRERVSQADILVLDYYLKDGKWDINGSEVIKKIKDEWGLEKESILYSGALNIDEALELVQEYNLHTFLKPAWDYEIKLFLFLKLAEEIKKRRQKEEEQSKKLDKSIIGDSEVINHVKDLIKKVASSKTSVLILGETGVGKELVAEGIHCSSPRKKNKFVSVNCGALPSELIESELFGYVKGAFTGAVRDTDGKFQAANGGTIFLDEIGNAPSAVQVKLLRALESDKVQKVGATKADEIDVRVIFATNRELTKRKEREKEPIFREDLFYRINVFPIKIPPLQQRKDDIPKLVDHFIKEINKELELALSGVATDAIALLKAYDFPGNIRELDNILKRTVLLSGRKEGQITKHDIQRAMNLDKESTIPSMPPLRKLLESDDPENMAEYFKTTKGIKVSQKAKLTELSQTQVQESEKRAYEALLKQTKGNVAELSNLTNMARPTLSSKLKKYKIQPSYFRNKTHNQ